MGLMPVASGTFGTLLGIPWSYVLFQLPGLAWQVLAVVVTCLLGVSICDRAARLLGNRKDPGEIVLDEILSLPITFLFIPAERLAWNDWPVWLAGFLLHRLFDITKPPPARQLEHLPGGLGIMADDCAAALYAGAVLAGVIHLGWLG